MAFDAQLAAAISQTFRSAITTRLTNAQRSDFEFFLQAWFGIKNRRNVELWTRVGIQQRNFINRNLGELEMDLRVFIASKFINNVEPSFPVKRKPFRLPANNENARESFNYFFNEYIREYCTRIYFDGNFFIIEYAADSNTNVEEVDLDSPEFDDILED